MAMQRFAVLSNVRHQQPYLPEVAEEDAFVEPSFKLKEASFNETCTSDSGTLRSERGFNSSNGHWSGERDRHKIRTQVLVSAQFDHLLKLLAQQHVKELSETRPGRTERTSWCTDSTDFTTPMERMESPQARTPLIETWQKAKMMARQRSPTVTDYSVDRLGTGEESDSLGLEKFDRQHSPSLISVASSRRMIGSPKLGETALAMVRSHLREVDAENVLSLWEEADSRSFGSNASTEGPRLARCRRWLQSKGFEFAMVCILLANVLWMALHLQVYGSTVLEGQSVSNYWVYAFRIGDATFATIFATEVCVRSLIGGRTFWRSWMSYLDLLVGISCVIEIYVMFSEIEGYFDFALLRLVRVIKIVKSVRMFNITSTLAPLHLLIKCLEACVGMLFWSFLLMSFVQCMAGIVVSELCYGFLEDDTNDETARELVYRYYGTFTRTMLSMFEIMFANWGPACRVLVDNVNEWFSLFFLVYRCVMGFAVLNVVGAVFVQQALKTASSDDDLAFRQKERDIQAYNRKVKKLFQSIDGSGDGAISLDEFTKLVQSPKLKFWMSQLELEYHDLLSLFEFLDNGDGQITLMEFIEGAQRLRGGAKALDIWRMETKIEVLFEEVLNVMAQAMPQVETVNVATVFEKSSFKHIRATRLGEAGEESPGPVCSEKMTSNNGNF